LAFLPIFGVLEPAHAVDSIVVTSLEDDGTEGTLRWAITQANANSGTIYDKITFSTSGTITLTASLPTVTSTLEVVGTEGLILDGGDLHGGFYISGGTLTISNVYFKHMKSQNSGWGAALFAVRSTIYANNITVDSSDRAIATKEGGTYIFLSDSTIKNNSTGLFSDHGGTPNTPTLDDTAYNNRIESTRVLFDNNSTAIYGERTMLVADSVFTNNGTAFLMRGLNKHRVTGSTFENNTTAINASNYWPAWDSYYTAPYINNTITGNTFKTNTTAISLNVRVGTVYTQVGANISSNSWDEVGTFIRSNEGSTSYTDTLAAREGAEYYAINNTSSVPPPPEPSISAPTNLSVTVNQDGSVSLTWDASVVNETAYLNYYVIAWNTADSGWAITTTNTYGTISASNFENTGGFDTEYLFKIRADDNDNRIYVWSEPVTNIMVSVTGPSEEELALAEAERIAAEEAASLAAAEQAAAEQAEADRLAAEQAEADALAAAQAEADRQAAAAAEAARQAAIKAEADRVAAEEAAKAAEEAAKQKAIADAKAEADRIAAEKAAEEATRLEAEAKAKADATAALAAAQAKAKADAEAKAKADAAAKVEADRIALAKAEADAKAKAKAAADAKAKAEALAKAEEASRLEAQRALEAEAALEGKEAVELEVPLEAAEVKEVVREISKIEEPRNLTTTQVAQITQVVNEVFASVEKDSEEYVAALEILAVLAEADDPELSEELAAIPVLGAVAGEVLNVLNDLGNVGADMSPEQRERSEETVVAAVIVGQVAQLATATAASAGVSAAAAASTRRIK
jgi:hypothetical protein